MVGNTEDADVTHRGIIAGKSASVQ